ncbi:MAG: glycosyltransferase family 4 protein [Cyclobacteriaceae bacterium]
MKILMFGWEYPPHISGGLGTACHGLTQALLSAGHEVKFVIPHAVEEEKAPGFELVSASNVNLSPFIYSTALRVLGKIMPELEVKLSKYPNRSNYKFSGAYGPGLMDEVYWFAVVASKLAIDFQFDIIHAHDWLTYLAGLVAKEVSGKPLVVHIHATEYDRSSKINIRVFEIEQKGMLHADRVLTVSNLTRNTVTQRYGINPAKVITTYNGVRPYKKTLNLKTKNIHEKFVTFLGRITYQKGPQYFIEAARKVLIKNQQVRFVMAGNGDMMKAMIRKVAGLRLSRYFHFTGFLKREQVEQMLEMSDVFVMPSVSEPFGIAPLEAIQSDVPVIVSKQSGVAEVLPYAIKVDYWDTNALADTIYGLLNYKAMGKTTKSLNQHALSHLTWDNAATKVLDVYSSIIK